jgi:hypothetical protein
VAVDDDWDSPWRIQARIATGQHLAAFIAFANGDPRLNEWQQGFLDSMADILRRMHGRVELSEKQAAVLLRMEDKLGGMAAVYGVDEASETDAVAVPAALDAA